MQVTRKPAFLISAGTAICGGSAIAAVGPIAGVNEQEMAVSLGAAFILNSVALLLFPLIGYAGALHSWGGFKLTRLAWVIRAVGKVPDTNCYGTSYRYSSSQRKSLYSSAGFQIYQWVEEDGSSDAAAGGKVALSDPHPQCLRTLLRYGGVAHFTLTKARSACCERFGRCQAYDRDRQDAAVTSLAAAVRKDRMSRLLRRSTQRHRQGPLIGWRNLKNRWNWKIYLR